MKNVILKDWEWVAHLQYVDGHESEFHIDSVKAVDILSAIAYVSRHIADFPHTEVISLQQVLIRNKLDISSVKQIKIKISELVVKHEQMCFISGAGYVDLVDELRQLSTSEGE